MCRWTSCARPGCYCTPYISIYIVLFRIIFGVIPSINRHLLETKETRANFHATPNQAGQRLVLDERQHRLQQQRLGQTQFGVRLHLGVRIVVGPPKWFANGLGQRGLASMALAHGHALLERGRCVGNVLLLEGQHRLQEREDAIAHRMVHAGVGPAECVCMQSEEVFS